ncbi:DUF6880 family protein [Asticcacaulis solisilvae]|uniref:DUF6880 family protein n=1 Tax=Asticcacaulis solisilvae TaxID=1217274 RepID=UPI003FD8DE86
MASKTTLNHKNLEALGAERLAELLIDISTGNANAKRRLRMELAAAESPDKLVVEIQKRLTSINNASTGIGWRTLKAFIADLETQRSLIATRVAPAAPAEAWELIAQLAAMGDATLARATDMSGELIAVFHRAALDMAAIAEAANPAPEAVTRRVLDAVSFNGYGQNDGLITALAPRLGPSGLMQLQDALLSGKTPERTAAPATRRVSRWRKRKLERAVARRRSRAETISAALMEIADALNDPDAWMALQSDLRHPDVAAGAADRLVAANRAEEALALLDRVRPSARELRPENWQAAHIRTLEALGRGGDAQAFRLKAFHDTLDPEPLRAYLKRLPDFDDIEAEDAALDYAVTFTDAHKALDFLVSWPSLDRAARLVTTRINSLDGNDEDLLPEAAEKLLAKYPLAATLLLRKLIDATLINSRSVAYEQAAQALSECRRLSAFVTDWQGFPDHAEYEGALRAAHPRKIDFWEAAAA